MLNIKYVKSIDEITFYPKSYDYFSCLLFHGTTRHMLEMSDEKRQEHIRMCDELVRYTLDIVKDISEEVLNKYLDDIHKEGRDTYIGSYSLFDGYGQSKMYEYGNFYVSFSLRVAKDYANNIGGELTRFAFDCAHMFKSINIEVREDIKRSIDYILDYYDKYQDDEHLIVLLTKVEFDDIMLENGFPFLKYFPTKEDINKEIDTLFENYSMDEVDSYSDAQGYRINNPEKYQMYALPIKMSEEVFDKVSNRQYKHYFIEALNLLEKNKGVTLYCDYHDIRNLDGSFELELEKIDKHFNKEFSFTVTFSPSDFVSEHTSIEDEAKIPDSIELDKKVLLRIAFRIYLEYRNCQDD